MMEARIGWSQCLLFVAFLLTTGPAVAVTPAPIERYETKLPVSDYRAGGARTTVFAPPSDVLSQVTDYAHYSEFISAFEASKVVGRAGAATDVYLRVKILHGAAKIWAVVRFEPAERGGDATTVTAHLVRGNVQRLDAVWRVEDAGEGLTRLSLILLIIPTLPVPEALVVPEVRDAAGTAVRGLRDEVERRSRGKR